MRARARAAAALLALAAGCARGEPLRLVALDCGAPDGAKLNQPLVLRFSGAVDPASVRATSVRVARERDGAPVEGRFKVDGAIVTFVPRGPCAADLADGAFQRGERYRVEVPALPVLACVRAPDGALLDGGGAASFAITDAPVDAPAERLFFDANPGVAARFDVSATLSGDRVRVRVSKPLDPRSLADAVFRFKGPWHSNNLPNLDPPFQARLVRNDDEAWIELTVSGPPPLPLAAGEKYDAVVPGGKLRDLSGAPQIPNEFQVHLTFVPMDAPDK